MLTLETLKIVKRNVFISFKAEAISLTEIEVFILCETDEA